MISVIVPVYNVEKYLERCLDSILNQTYSDLEIILVDDGSTDTSPEICDAYAKRDERIRTFHQKNGGLSAARNTGLDNARGDYIGFVDSDDQIVPTMYESLLVAMENEKADIAIGNFAYLDEQGRKAGESFPLKKAVYSGIQAMEQLLCDAVHFVSSCNKLYRKDIYKNIRYPLGKLNEDQFVIHRMLYESSRVVTISEPVYLYTIRSGSIMHRTFSVKHLDDIEAICSQYLFLQDKHFDSLLPEAANKLKYSYDAIRGKIKIQKPQELLRVWKVDRMFRKTLFHAPIVIPGWMKMVYRCPDLAGVAYRLLRGIKNIGRKRGEE